MLAGRTILLPQTNTFTYEARMQQQFNDGIDIKQQSVEINPIEHIRRCSFYKNIDIWTYYKTAYPNARTIGDALHEGYLASNDGPCVGYLQPSNGTESLQWLSYSTVIERSRCIGSYLWTKTKLTPTQSKVAILSSNRPEYLFVEQGCYMYGFIVVGLYTNYDSATIQKVLQRTGAEVLVVDSLDRIRPFQEELLNNKQIKEIIVLDEVTDERKSKIRSLPSIFQTMKDIDITERPTVDPHSISTFILTSGTTGETRKKSVSENNLFLLISGEPKIAMLSHENLLAASRGSILRLEKGNVTKSVTARHCSFLPMAHIYERFVLLQVLLRGTEVVFCPSPEKLLDYLSIVKPTQVSVVPRVLNKVYDAVMADVNKSKIKQFLVQQALREQPWFLSRFVFRKVKNLFGGELKTMITGSAPIKADIMHFFRIALDIPIMEGYGQTESAAAGTSTHPIDMSYGTIGSPVPTVEIKLIDVPGTDYLSKTGQGEVCLRGPTIFKGKSI
jgi:long-chain acyl-CoA synthetase